MIKVNLIERCIAVRIVMESPDHAPRMNGLEMKSLYTAQIVFANSRNTIK